MDEKCETLSIYARNINLNWNFSLFENIIITLEKIGKIKYSFYLAANVVLRKR